MSLLCHLAYDDVVGAKKQMAMYCIEDPSFDGSREQQLVDALIKAIEEQNRDEFVMAVSEFNQITPFNKVKNSILVKIKETLLPDDPGQVAGEIDFTGELDSKLISGGTG